MILPKPRGSLSEVLFAALLTAPDVNHPPHVEPDDEVDAALSLWVLHELSYRGFEDVADDAEWDPALLCIRRELERDLEGRLRGRWPRPKPADGDFATSLFA
jgi:hypothetical protein